MIDIVSLINRSKTTDSQSSLRKDRKDKWRTDQQTLLECYINTEKVLPRASLSHYRNKTSSFNRCSSYPVRWYQLSLPLQNCLIAFEKEQDTLEYSFYRFRQHALRGKYNQHTRTVMHSMSLVGHVVYYSPYHWSSTHDNLTFTLCPWTNWIIFNDLCKTWFCRSQGTALIDKRRMKFSNWLMLMSLVPKANKEQEHIIKTQL